MKISSYGLTHPGKKRTKNDDFYLIDEELGLNIVCDGVGGRKSGNIAAELCARTVREVIHQNAALIREWMKVPNQANRSKMAQLIQQALETANYRVFEEASKDPANTGMATTAEVVLFAGKYAIVGHVGDSRVYLYRNGGCHQLTEDHKVATEMIKQGIWTPEEAYNNEYAHTITRAVGVAQFIKIDLLQVELADNDIFVLCSDGLADYLPQRQLLSGMVSQTDLNRLPDHLLKYALESGGADNVTIVSTRVEPEEEQELSTFDVLKKEEILGKVPLFRYLSYPELMKVLSIVKLKSFTPKSILISEGSPSDEMYVIVTGKVVIKKSGQVLADAEKGAVFGEMGLFDNAPRSASIYAKEDTKTMVIPRKDLLALLRRESQIAVKLLWALNQDLNERLRTTSKNLAEAKANLEVLAREAPFPLPEQMQEGAQPR